MNLSEKMVIGRARAHGHRTHEVKNQARPASGYNAFLDDIALANVVKAYAPWAAAKCAVLGELVGNPSMQELANLANENQPELRSHDAYGNRCDWVHYHPAWHQLMQLAFGHEVHSLARTAHKLGHMCIGSRDRFCPATCGTHFQVPRNREADVGKVVFVHYANSTQ